MGTKLCHLCNTNGFARKTHKYTLSWYVVLSQLNHLKKFSLNRPPRLHFLRITSRHYFHIATHVCEMPHEITIPGSPPVY